MVMCEVLMLIGADLLFGAMLALSLASLVRSQLFGLDPHDPWTLIGAALILTVAASFAGFIPALRASRVDPMIALRHE
jgi:ABC-type antimicrobial peptide transport system permease subunit